MQLTMHCYAGIAHAGTTARVTSVRQVSAFFVAPRRHEPGEQGLEARPPFGSGFEIEHQYALDAPLGGSHQSPGNRGMMGVG